MTLEQKTFEFAETPDSDTFNSSYTSKNQGKKKMSNVRKTVYTLALGGALAGAVSGGYVLKKMYDSIPGGNYPSISPEDIIGVGIDAALSKD